MSSILLAVAVVCFAVAAFLGFGVFHGSHILGWVALGLVAFSGSFLAPVVAARRP